MTAEKQKVDSKLRKKMHYLIGRIKSKMDNEQISQSDLAERMGCCRASVSYLLRRKEGITLRTLYKIANALDMDVDLKLKNTIKEGEKNVTHNEM